MNKYSIASRKRMMAIPEAERKEIMRELARKRHRKMTKAQRRAHAMMMVEARLNKKHDLPHRV